MTPLLCLTMCCGLLGALRATWAQGSLSSSRCVSFYQGATVITCYICDRLGTYVPFRICPASVMTAPSAAVAVLSFLPLDSALMASMTCGTLNNSRHASGAKYVLCTGCLLVGRWCLDHGCIKVVVGGMLVLGSRLYHVVVQHQCNPGCC